MFGAMMVLRLGDFCRTKPTRDSDDPSRPRREQEERTTNRPSRCSTRIFFTTKPAEDACDISVGQNERTDRERPSTFNSIFCKTKPTGDSFQISMGQDECVSGRRLRCSCCVRK